MPVDPRNASPMRCDDASISAACWYRFGVCRPASSSGSPMPQVNQMGTRPSPCFDRSASPCGRPAYKNDRLVTVSVEVNARQVYASATTCGVVSIGTR